jgi:hypothetical protein
MAKYSVVKITRKSNGTEYRVYWNQDKHDHGANVAAGTYAMTQLAAVLGCGVADLEYRQNSFRSNQPEPTGNNIVEIT